MATQSPTIAAGATEFGSNKCGARFVKERWRRIAPFPERQSEKCCETNDQNTRDPNIMKTNDLSAPVIKPNPSLVAITGWDIRSPAISLMETKRTRVRGVGFAFLLAAFLGSCITSELHAQVVVVPNSLATNDGNGSATSASGSASVRWLHIHDASQFGALPGPSLLTKFAYRPDMFPGESGPRSLTLRIYASTASRSVAELSTTFAENVGTNNTLVFNGTVNLSTENLPGPGNTRQFDYVFPFTTPFLYDPAAGNLVLDLQIVANGSAVTFDTVSGDPAIGRVFKGGSSTATTGDLLYSHVTQFTFEPPPFVTIRTSQVEVCWNSIPNLTYQVQYRSDLTANVWTPLGGCIRSDSSTSCAYDPIVVGQPERFYRVVLANCVP
jgi:hypothetical protein